MSDDEEAEKNEKDASYIMAWHGMQRFPTRTAQHHQRSIVSMLEIIFNYFHVAPVGHPKRTQFGQFLLLFLLISTAVLCCILIITIHKRPTDQDADADVQHHKGIRWETNPNQVCLLH